MPVTVKFFTNFREATGLSQIDIEPTPKDVRSLLDELVKKFGQKLAGQLFEPKSCRLRDNVVILINGHSIKLLEGLGTSLKSGDLVTGDVAAILQVVGGG